MENIYFYYCLLINSTSGIEQSALYVLCNIFYKKIYKI